MRSSKFSFDLYACLHAYSIAKPEVDKGGIEDNHRLENNLTLFHYYIPALGCLVNNIRELNEWNEIILVALDWFYAADNCYIIFMCFESELCFVHFYVPVLRVSHIKCIKIMKKLGGLK